MINGEITEFIDKLYYGEELWFEYEEVTYFIQGWIKDGEATMVLDLCDYKPFKNYVWKCVKPSLTECAEEFLNLSLWNGRTFLEIEKKVTWKEY